MTTRNNSKIVVTATVRELRTKAVWLTLDDNTSLWFQLRSAKDNGDGTWTITQKAYDNAMAEHRIWLESVELNNSNVTFDAGTWGTCRNGSYYLRTRGICEATDQRVNTQLAFVRTATVNDDGTLTVRRGTALSALNDAAFRTGVGTLTISFVGCDAI